MQSIYQVKGGESVNGWIKVHRKILENDIWQDVNRFRLFMFLLLNAAHKDGMKINGVTLKRGQYLRSYSKLIEDLEYREGRGTKRLSKSTIMRNVKKLIENGMVTVSETDSGTLFTIVNYAEYQGFEGNEEHERGTDNEPNAERSRNEVGTNAELKQECKNVRIKEIYSSTTSREEEENVFHVFENEGFGTISSVIADRLDDLVNTYGNTWTIEAMKEAVFQGKRNIRYVEGILRRWKASGIDEPWKQQSKVTPLITKKRTNDDFRAMLDKVAERWGG